MLAAAVIVLAAGYYVPETGVESRAKGGAFAAMTGEPLGMVFNPASLTGAKQELLVDVTSLWQWETFSRTDIPSDSTASTKATNKPPPQIVPNVIYTHPIGERFVVAVGLHAPAGPRYKFADKGPQRFSVGELYLIEASYGAALAYRPHKMIAVGLEVEGMVHGVEHRLYVTSQNVPPPSESETLDQPQELDVMDSFTPNVRLGVIITPIDGLDIGLSYRPPTEADCSGTVYSPETGGGFREKVHFKFAVASIFRAGVRWSKPSWDVEADFVIEDWSQHDVQTLTADDGNFPGTTGIVEVPREFTSSIGLRLGGSWAASEKLRVLGGWFYESSAVPDERVDAGSLDADKHGLNVGATLTVGRFDVTGAYTHVLLATRTITNSENRQQSPFAETDPNALSIISNGKYTSSYDMLGLSLSTRF